MKRSTKKNSKKNTSLDKVEKNPVGRPTKKTDVVVNKIFELAKKGKTMREIADIAQLSTRTIYDWIESDYEFSTTLKELKDEADQVVEAATFKRAIGYMRSFENEKVTKDGDVIRYQETVHVPSHPTSQIFWLKNRKPKEWRDRVEVAPGEPIKFRVGFGEGEDRLGNKD